MLSLPTGKSVQDRLADWIETAVLFGDAGTVSLAQLLDWVEEEGIATDLDLYDDVRDPDLGGDDDPSTIVRLRSESAEGVGPGAIAAHDALLRVQDRADIVGDHYPVRLEGNVAQRVVQSWRDAPVYAFMLALNARHFHHLDADFQTGARLFERVVVVALAAYWGGEAAHFGWPRDTGEAGAFREAFPRIVRQMRERLTCQPDALPGRLKDLAVDVVAWRALDTRRGQSVILCQCAVGADWEDKGLHIEEWQRLISFAVSPIKGLAFPFVPESERPFSDIDWELLSARGGVPFDRLRLARLTPDVPDQLREQLVEWTGSLASVLGD